MNNPTDLSSQEHLHDVMMSHIMSSSRSGSSPPLLPLVDLHQYLCMASVIEVELNEDASILYVASRRIRMSASRGMDIPIGALNSMYVFQLVMYVWFSIIVIGSIFFCIDQSKDLALPEESSHTYIVILFQCVAHFTCLSD